MSKYTFKMFLVKFIAELRRSSKTIGGHSVISTSTLMEGWVFKSSWQAVNSPASTWQYRTLGTYLILLTTIKKVKLTSKNSVSWTRTNRQMFLIVSNMSMIKFRRVRDKQPKWSYQISTRLLSISVSICMAGSITWKIRVKFKR